MTKKKIERSDYEFGLNTFGDLAAKEDGKLTSYAEALRLVVEETKLADEIGIDIMALGEHHRHEYAISSPSTVLAGLATATKNIKLGTAVTVLSSEDPVRVYQQFATIDALSNGRAQIMLGRGSFTESFPLFGYNLTDYEVLFEEKIELFSKIIKEEPVTWQGSTRAGLDNVDIFPKTEKGKLDVTVGVGGSPQSVVRAAAYEFPIMFAIIGGAPDRFKAFTDLYRRAAQDLGKKSFPIGLHSPGFIAKTDEEAVKKAFPYFKTAMDGIGKTRGWQPMSREHFLQEVNHGSMYVGSPETVAKKIARTMRVLGATRFDLVYGFGPVPIEERRETIRLYGEEVIPRVIELLNEDTSGEDGGK